MNDIQHIARRFRRSQQAYEEAFRCFFREQVQPLPTVRFWELQGVFADALHTYRFGYDRTNGVEQAAGEFFRKALAQDFHSLGARDVPVYSLTEALQLAKRWRTLVSELDDALSPVVEHRSDDAYGDLLDALPLAGHDVCTQALAGRFRDNQNLEDAVRSACQATPGMTNLILRGENYVAMTLYEAAREYYPPFCNVAD